MRKNARNSLIAILLVVLTATAVFLVLPLPGSIPVLMYHFVEMEQEAINSSLYVSREGFRKQMDFLHRFGYRVLSMDEYYATRTGKRKPLGREVVITFDDGHTSFAERAFPILKKYQFPVTIFLVSHSVPRPDTGSMNEATLKELLRYPWISIGSHSQTHPSLSTLSREDIRREVAGSKKDLEDLFVRPIHYLTYPSGAVSSEVAEEVKAAGYRLAFTTSRKKLKGLSEGLYTIPRIKISRVADNPIAFWGQLSGLYEGWKIRYAAFKAHTRQLKLNLFVSK